tara:strand:+ start:163 stop:1473 length:1311 start_codon:yes stop_codon:yes gene_type:complete
MNISVIGLGRLGLPFSFFLASKGHKILAYDKDLTIKKKIKQKQNIEPFLDHYIKRFKKNVFFKYKINDLINNSAITFIVLPTPSNNNGSFSNSFILKSLKEIALMLKLKRNKNHTIVITSTVSPGSCDKFVSFMERQNLINNKDFSFVYNPHFIAQGTTLHNLEKPDLILIGTDNQKTKNNINSFYKKIYKKKELLKNTNFKEGEISKIAINCYITTKISFSNYISEISESEKNIDAKKILDVIGQDKRINNAYMKVGTKFSGPCFPRDNSALINYSKKIKINPFIPIATNLINSKQSYRIIKILKKMLKKNKKKISLGLFGLTYKPDTNLIEGSQGDSLLKEINKKKLKFKKINIFDKFLTSNSVKKYNKRLSFFKSKISFLNNSDIIIIMYPSSENDILKRYKTKKNKFILDCWRKNMKLNNNLKLVEFGKYFD